MADHIEREIRIDAPPERVWAVLTDPGHIGEWFGTARAAEVDLRPGGVLKLDFGANGVFPNRIVTVDPPRRFSYRSASGFPGAIPTQENSTLVEFSLHPDGEGTILRLRESGFDAISIPPAQPKSANFNSHARGWPHTMERLRVLAEQAP